MENRNKTLMTLVECALFVAAALVLDLFKIYEMPNGGAVKLVMVPLFIIAFRRGAKWGTFSSMVYLVVAIILGREGIFYPGSTLTIIIVCILFDYVLAYAVIGLAPVIAKPFKNRVVGYSVATFAVCFIRFISHFISGATIWADVTQGAKGVILFSITYNGAYMLPITIVSVIIIAILAKAAPKLFLAE